MLHTELAALGFTGSVQTRRRWLHPLRAATPAAPQPIRPAVPKPRHITRWIMTDPQHLAPDEDAQLTDVLGSCPELRAVAGHVRDFADLMNKHRGDRLPDWMLWVQAVYCASQAKVHEKWVDRALSARPDLFDGLVAALDGDDDPALAVDRLKKAQPELFDTLSFVVAGSYLMNPAVTKALGMPGNAPKPKPALPDEADHYLSGGALDPVIARGPIYRPTPDAQPRAY
ncbi:hypothetical protein AB0J72_25795 [Dactylosporangium sp. NPDC049742]|uniref:hypothetical protein n=1 Tax=Dactylosporangium sp. NPDC049742 TaxID=3154737 RepID=UPI00342E37B7